MCCLSSRVYFFFHRRALKWQRAAAALISCRSFAPWRLSIRKTSEMISDGLLFLPSISDVPRPLQVYAFKVKFLPWRLGSFIFLLERSKGIFAFQKPVVKVCPPFSHKIICEVADRQRGKQEHFFFFYLNLPLVQTDVSLLGHFQIFGSRTPFKSHRVLQHFGFHSAGKSLPLHQGIACNGNGNNSDLMYLSRSRAKSAALKFSPDQSKY